MWYVGLDVHLRSTAACILDENGKIVKRGQFAGHLGRVLAWLEGLPEPLAVCYEASCGYGHLHDQLRKVAPRVVVAHPGQLRLIFRSKRKNDRIDAMKLATLLFLDQVPEVYVPSVDVRSWRRLIEFRHRLVADRTRVKNRLRALLREYGLEGPRGGRLWTRKGRAWLAELTWPTSQAAVMRDVLVDDLERCQEKIGRVEQVLNRIAKASPGVALLRTIPGVGPRTAEAMVAYLDDPKRFRNSKRIGSYFGLVPCQDQSADRNRLGHITREGPATVRKLVTEASWRGVRQSPRIQKYFERIAGGDRDRKKIALIATAHYLLRVMFAMLRDGRPWSEDDLERGAA